ncbi:MULTISPECIES: pirin family protein [Myxococcus]|nr:MULTISPECIES: pirin family protein [Myxococcus]UYI13432.1 pirin family protein [Myxococcus xanthus]UYI20799.1 pirin family protein [Myxococcus xanthus]
MPHLVHRTIESLPTTTLQWLSLRDHFVATVGPRAGEGRRMGPVLVLADATFAPHSRFPIHPHREMDILSVVVDGSLSHHGDQAHGVTLGPRSAQLISARSGIVHAEGNDTDQPTRMLQIWFQPNTFGGAPAYFTRELAGQGRQLLAGDPEMPLRADARLWWVDLVPGSEETLIVDRARQGYLLAMTSRLRIAAVGSEPTLELAIGEGLEVGPGAVSVSSDRAGAALWLDVA